MDKHTRSDCAGRDVGQLHIISSHSHVLCFLINMKMVKTLPSVAEKCVTIHPLCRKLIGVDLLHKCCFSTNKKKRMFLYYFCQQ